MLQHYFHMSYAYYKFDNQMYFFSCCLLHFTNPILHNLAIRPLIHMGLSDNPTQKKLPKFCFLFLSKTIYMYKANIILLYLMCAVESSVPHVKYHCYFKFLPDLLKNNTFSI